MPIRREYAAIQTENLMGAHDYVTTIKVKPSTKANEAFRMAAENDEYEHGHDSYTGDIAQASGIYVLTFKKGTRRSTKMTALHAEIEIYFDRDCGDHRRPSRGVSKWGKAACADLGLSKNIETGKWERTFAFAGIAAS